jgi:hypothetical protein
MSIMSLKDCVFFEGDYIKVNNDYVSPYTSVDSIKCTHTSDNSISNRYVRKLKCQCLLDIIIIHFKELNT